MPTEIWRPALAGGARWPVVVRFLLAELRWAEPEVSSSVPSPSLKNKPEGASELQDLDRSDPVLAAMEA